MNKIKCVCFFFSINCCDNLLVDYFLLGLKVHVCYEGLHEKIIVRRENNLAEIDYRLIFIIFCFKLYKGYCNFQKQR